MSEAEQAGRRMDDPNCSNAFLYQLVTELSELDLKRKTEEWKSKVVPLSRDPRPEAQKLFAELRFWLVYWADSAAWSLTHPNKPNSFLRSTRILLNGILSKPTLSRTVELCLFLLQRSNYAERTTRALPSRIADITFTFCGARVASACRKNGGVEQPQLTDGGPLRPSCQIACCVVVRLAGAPAPVPAPKAKAKAKGSAVKNKKGKDAVGHL